MGIQSRPTKLRQRPSPKWTAERWPNSLGWNLASTTGRHYELWPSGSVVELRTDDSSTGYAGMRYCETGERNIDNADVAIEIVADALICKAWKPCYDIAPEAIPSILTP